MILIYQQDLSKINGNIMICMDFITNKRIDKGSTQLEKPLFSFKINWTASEFPEMISAVFMVFFR